MYARNMRTAFNEAIEQGLEKKIVIHSEEGDSSFHKHQVKNL